MTDKKELGFATRAIHDGSEPDPVTGAVIPPIFATSTYAQDGPGKHRGYVYARSSNPTRTAWEKCIASLEDAAVAYAFSSGLAATSAILDLLPTNSHVIAVDDIYGGTFRLFDKVRKTTCGLEVSYLDLEDPTRLEKEVRSNTKMVWIETPTNPLLKIIDIEGIVKAAKQHGLLVVVDNTFASPYLQKPLTLGADIVIHSATKYLNGHSDVIHGVVAFKERGEISDRLKFIQNAVGAVPGPFDCFLVHRGVKTLAVRMKQACESASKLATYLEKSSKVEKVYYPGLPSHSGYQLAKKQMTSGGAMISFIIKGGLSNADSFLRKVKIFTLAESLGGVESLIEHPATMTHASIPAEQRAAIGLVDGLIRISVGIEEFEDLLQDIEQALES